MTHDNLSVSDAPSEEVLAQQFLERLGSNLRSFAPLVPLLFRLNGEVMTLSNGFSLFQPIFDVRTPRRTVLKCGRQVGKTTSAAARQIIRAFAWPHYSIVTVAPRKEQSNRISNLFYRPLIAWSTSLDLLIDDECVQSVSHRSFRNGSNLFFSYAFLDADRVRGIPANEMVVDEAQDIDFDLLPTMRHCMDQSPYGKIESYYGTAKTFDNTLEALWQQSSMAEWVVQCPLGHWNTPNQQMDLMKMIGRNGPVCAKCGARLNVRNGRWEHMAGSRRNDFIGLHIPQIVTPEHTESEVKWRDILWSREKESQAHFLNEVMGESCDVGVRLISQPELVRACQLHPNTLEEAVKARARYTDVVMGVDWGGRGSDGTSRTVLSVIARAPDRKLHVLYGEQLNLSDEFEEVSRILHVYRLLSCRMIAHDFGGAGVLRESILIQSGFPGEHIMPIAWTVSFASEIITYHPPGELDIRSYYLADKPRGLSLALCAIKAQLLLFTEYESSKLLVDQWLALIEETKTTSKGREIHLIKRNPNLSDDYAQATTYGCLCLWYTLDDLPDLARAMNVTLPAGQRTFTRAIYDR